MPSVVSEPAPGRETHVGTRGWGTLGYGQGFALAAAMFDLVAAVLGALEDPVPPGLAGRRSERIDRRDSRAA